MHWRKQFELITWTLPSTAPPSISEQHCTLSVSVEGKPGGLQALLASTVFRCIKDLWLTKVGLLARGREQGERGVGVCAFS